MTRLDDPAVKARPVSALRQRRALIYAGLRLERILADLDRALKAARA